MTTASKGHDYRELFVGADCEVPLLDGSKRRYVDLDNAASTPSLRAVQRAVDNFLIYYSSVHRGTGFKSQVSTEAYEQARAIVLDFVGADPASHVCIFGKNTTEAINKLARRLPFSAERDIVLLSSMEHHANDLPWRAVASVVHVGLTPEGRLDEADFDTQLACYGERVALVAIAGASNVTGYINPIHRLARKAHAHGAQIAVDCAQLAPHRAITMLALDDPEHLDYVMISGHKLYAPFGTGALIGRRDTFEQGEPDLRGGGTVELVTLDDVIWAAPPEREEAGSPNTVGAIALAAALRQLQSIGMGQVAQHEAELTAYALQQMGRIPGVRLSGDTDPQTAGDRLGAIPFNVDGIIHFLTAAILSYEHGIGVRHGCFCAHHYTLYLLHRGKQQTDTLRTEILQHNKTHMPGLVRASFGLCTTREDIDALAEALEQIARGSYRGCYEQDVSSGEFHPLGWHVDYQDYFKL